MRVTELLHSGKYTPSPINDKDKKSAGLVSSFPSFNKREELLILSDSPVGQPQLTENLGKQKPQHSIH